MTDFRRQRFVFVLAIFVISFFLYIHSSRPEAPSILHRTNVGTFLDLPDLPAANATLGFGAIAAVSRATSPRREGLVLAANITELDITIPVQPVWTEKDVAGIRAENHSRITNGSALAWLGHHNVLRWFLATDLETVLILEDDVDWDIHLRTSQIPKAAAAVRLLMAPQSPKPDYVEKHFLNPAHAGGYWGPPNDAWDILYLGHCGDIFSPNKWNFQVPRAAFDDRTMPARKDLHLQSRKFLDSLEIPEYTRMIHRSIFPLCTFGFALTRKAASRLLYEIAPRETVGGTEAYDVRILEACRDEGMKCWSAQPELFHHMDAESEIAVVNRKEKERVEKEQAKEEERAKQEAKDRAEEEKMEKEAQKAKEEAQQNGQSVPGDARIEPEKSGQQRPEGGKSEDKKKQAFKDDTSKNQAGPAQKGGDQIKDKEVGIDEKKVDTDAQGRLQGPLTGKAPNIECGARGKNFRTQNPATLEYLREVVGRQGKCLRDVVEEDMSRNPLPS